MWYLMDDDVFHFCYTCLNLFITNKFKILKIGLDNTWLDTIFSQELDDMSSLGASKYIDLITNEL